MIKFEIKFIAFSYLYLYSSINCLLNEKNIIFEDNTSLIYDWNSFRFLSSVNDTGWQGIVSLEHPEWIEMECLQLILGALFIVPEPKNVLIVGLGVGILTQAFDDILDPDYTSIDVVEIDAGMFDLAKRYFFFDPSRRVNVFISDGFDYIMSLLNTQLYDIIVLDAFAKGFCAPDSFFSIEFILKIKQQLTSNGIMAVNTLSDCSRHHKEMHMYQSVFTKFFVSELIDTNRVFLGMKSKMPSFKQIQTEVEFWRNHFLTFNVDADWLVNAFHFDRKRSNRSCSNSMLNFLVGSICYHFDDSI